MLSMSYGFANCLVSRLCPAAPQQSSDGGLLLLREAERKLGVCRRLAEAMPDQREPDRVRHAMFEMVMARASAIACGYEDAIDLDRLRHDPWMKVAVGRCPESGGPLASQSTISRLKNAPSKTEAARLSAALLDQLGTTKAGQAGAPRHRRHVLRGAWRPAACILERASRRAGQRGAHCHQACDQAPAPSLAVRPASCGAATATMGGSRRWNGQKTTMPTTFSVAGNAALNALAAEAAVNLRLHHAMSNTAKPRTYAKLLYQAGSWRRPRKVVARLECSLQPGTSKHKSFDQTIGS